MVPPPSIWKGQYYYFFYDNHCYYYHYWHYFKYCLEFLVIRLRLVRGGGRLTGE